MNAEQRLIAAVATLLTSLSDERLDSCITGKLRYGHKLYVTAGQLKELADTLESIAPGFLARVRERLQSKRE